MGTVAVMTCHNIHNIAVGSVAVMAAVTCAVADTSTLVATVRVCPMAALTGHAPWLQQVQVAPHG